jgi:hypothetical protein
VSRSSSRNGSVRIRIVSTSITPVLLMLLFGSRIRVPPLICAIRYRFHIALVAC